MNQQDILASEGKKKKKKAGKWWERRKAIHRHPIFRKLTPTEYQVLAVYEDYVNSKTCLCRPTLGTIAETLGWAKSNTAAVAKAKTGLVQKGVLKVVDPEGQYGRSLVEITVPGEPASSNANVATANQCSGATANQSSASETSHCGDRTPATANQSSGPLRSIKATTANQRSQTISYRTTKNNKETTTATVASPFLSCSPVAVGEWYGHDDVIAWLMGYGASKDAAKEFISEYGLSAAANLVRQCYYKEKLKDKSQNPMIFCRWAVSPMMCPYTNPIRWLSKIELEPMPPKGHRYTPLPDQDNSQSSGYRESPAMRPLDDEHSAVASPDVIVTRAEKKTTALDMQMAARLYESGGAKEPTPTRKVERVDYDREEEMWARRHLERKLRAQRKPDEDQVDCETRLRPHIDLGTI